MVVSPTNHPIFQSPYIVLGPCKGPCHEPPFSGGFFHLGPYRSVAGDEVVASAEGETGSSVQVPLGSAFGRRTPKNRREWDGMIHRLYCYWVGSSDFKLFGFPSYFLSTNKK